jgi:uncharacterized membrane protein YedE/YeeE
LVILGNINGYLILQNPMENFTPYTAFAGGILIGLSITVMLLFNGRITGISGILAGLLTPKTGEWFWRFVFILGLMTGAFIFVHVFPGSYIPRTDFPLGLLISSGFLVGFGTSLGSGCTSGHGICGIGRLSPRSIVATMIFMASGAVSVFVIRHLLGLTS